MIDEITHLKNLAKEINKVFIDEEDPRVIFLVAIKLAGEMAVAMDIDHEEFMKACHAVFQLSHEQFARGDMH